MSASAMASHKPIATPAAGEDFDVLALCEVWLALDFPEPTAAEAAAPLEPEEAP